MLKKYLENTIPKLNNQNNIYLEISFGKKYSDRIFDTKIKKDKINKIKQKLQSILFNKKKTLIKAKIYYNNNLKLFINNLFQPKCFEETVLEHHIFDKKNFDLNLKVANKKMLSIEHFPNKFSFHNEIFKIIESYNINNKFFLNFVENIENSSKYYSLNILITKKNSKINDIINLLQKIIKLIENN